MEQNKSDFKEYCGETLMGQVLKRDEKEVIKSLAEEFVLDYGTKANGDKGVYDKMLNGFITQCKNGCNFCSKGEYCYDYVFYTDIEQFKPFNDFFSEEFGDIIIAFISNYLNNMHQSNIIIVRTGGDEFHGYHLIKDITCGIEAKLLKEEKNGFFFSDVDIGEDEKYATLSKQLYNKLKNTLTNEKEFVVEYHNNEDKPFVLKNDMNTNSSKLFELKLKGLKLRYGISFLQSNPTMHSWGAASIYKTYKKKVSDDIVTFFKKENIVCSLEKLYDDYLENNNLRKTKCFITECSILNEKGKLDSEEDSDKIILTHEFSERKITNLISKIFHSIKDKSQIKYYVNYIKNKYHCERGDFSYDIQVYFGEVDSKNNNSANKCFVKDNCKSCDEQISCSKKENWIRLKTNIVLFAVGSETAERLDEFFVNKKYDYDSYLQENEQKVKAFRISIPDESQRDLFLDEICSSICNYIEDYKVANNIEDYKVANNIYTLSKTKISDKVVVSNNLAKNNISKFLESELWELENNPKYEIRW